VTRDGEEAWLGWIDIVERQHQDLAAFAALSGDVKAAGFKSCSYWEWAGLAYVLSFGRYLRPAARLPELRIV